MAPALLVLGAAGTFAAFEASGPTSCGGASSCGAATSCGAASDSFALDPAFAPLTFDLERELAVARRERRYILPEVAPMGATLMYTWVDTQRGAVRVAGRSAGRWVLAPRDLADACRGTVPRVAAKEERALVAFVSNRHLELAYLAADRLLGRERVALSRPSGLPPQVVPLPTGWGVFFVDGGELRYLRVGDGGELGPIQSLVRGGAFAVAARGEELHVVVWQQLARRESDAELEPWLLLEHLRYDLAGHLLQRKPLRRGRLAALEELSPTGALLRAESRVLQNALCVGPVDGAESCRRERTLFSELEALPGGGGLLLDQPLSFRPRGVRISRLGEGLSEPRTLDPEGLHPRLARAGDDLYVAVWSRPEGLRVALLGADGRVRHQADLQP